MAVAGRRGRCSVVVIVVGFFSHLCLSLAFWQHAVDAVSSGVSPFKDTAYNSSYWDKGSAFFFAGTVITTIGKILDQFPSDGRRLSQVFSLDT